VSNRTTTHHLATAMFNRKDSPIRHVAIGRFIIMWDDRSKHAAVTTIDTDEIFGRTSHDSETA